MNDCSRRYITHRLYPCWNFECCVKLAGFLFKIFLLFPLQQVQAHRRDLATPNNIRPLHGRSNGESPGLAAPTPPPLRESPIGNSLHDSLVHPAPAYRYQVNQENVGGTTYFYPTTASGDSPPNTGFQGFAGNQTHVTQEESNIPPSMSFYVSESVKTDILEKNALIMLQPDPRLYPDLPTTVDNYHELVPLEPLPIGDPLQISLSSTYKATNIKTGVRYCLRRIHGFRLSSTKCMVLVDMWKRLSHTNIVQLKEVFTTKAFGDNCKFPKHFRFPSFSAQINFFFFYSDSI